MNRQRQLTFNFQQQIEEPAHGVKNPKAIKSKFMRDLNYKSNAVIRSQRNNKISSNSRQKDFVMKKQRSRKNSGFQIGSLLQKAIPGAKILKGQWKDNKLNGEASIQYDNGNRFQGKYQNGVRVEGKMFYVEGNCEYQGAFFAQKFSGYGKLTYYEGRTIEGEWDNMQFVGNATITYPNGHVYYGPVDQQLYKHGEGYLFMNDGFKYIGTFKHGSISGLGSYFKEQKLVTKGIWQKGKLIKQLKNGEQSDAFDSQHRSHAPGQTSIGQMQMLNFKLKRNQIEEEIENSSNPLRKQSFTSTQFDQSILNLGTQEKQMIESDNSLRSDLVFPMSRIQKLKQKLRKK